MSRPGLVTTEWLIANLDNPKVKIFDASLDAALIIPGSHPSGRPEYENAHIPGAFYFDIDLLSDPDSALPHTLPSSDFFTSCMQEFGVNTDDHIVVYDNSPLRSACRAWWMFRVFGHSRVSVLNGGWAAWMAGNNPIEEATAEPGRNGSFKAVLNPNLLRHADDVLAVLNTANVPQILDPRGAPRFEGTVPEPRAGLRSGHIPGAINVPFPLLFNDDAGLKPDADLQAIFEQAGADLNKPIVTSCGSGVTACNLALALYTLGKQDVAVYDGSWSEWGGLDHCPIETGPAKAKSA